MARKQWNTTLDEDKLSEFQNMCECYGLKYNTVLEALMVFFTQGKCEIVIDINGIRIEYKD